MIEFGEAVKVGASIAGVFGFVIGLIVGYTKLVQYLTELIGRVESMEHKLNNGIAAQVRELHNWMMEKKAVDDSWDRHRKDRRRAT